MKGERVSVIHTEYNFAIEIWVGCEARLIKGDMVAVGVAVGNTIRAANHFGRC